MFSASIVNKNPPAHPRTLENMHRVALAFRPHPSVSTPLHLTLSYMRIPSHSNSNPASSSLELNSVQRCVLPPMNEVTSKSDDNC
ncbi:hypothetical protein AVEN_54674-1 [Araneus ventricosus]|uniref:Uncharacterized protein n=1 Tax=Araneus ventricosus TaxID=182803 RepID=A0A4Y2BN71_ARAVE|nr:hypothetical protein AVEN_54674-1 [Araneus ventricosus]